MKIAVMSDLHTEFEAGRGPSRPTAAWYALRDLRRATPGHPDVGPDLTQAKAAGVKLAILAGDIGIGTAGMAYAREVSRFLGCPVAYVPGNHEYYRGHDIPTLDAKLHDLAGLMPDSEVYFLQNDRWDFKSGGQHVVVLGTTMWTDYGLYARSAMHPDRAIARGIMAAAGGLSDHAPGMISICGNHFHPQHARQLNDMSRRWLEREITRARAEQPEAQIIVVTHHAPVRDAVPERFQGSDLSAAFANDMQAEIEAWGPDLWVYGHTHSDLDMMIGRTRVLSSQRGYIGSETGTDSYRPAIIELGGRVQMHKVPHG